ncbi:MAG: DUF896 domain-containing protein [Clostridiales bacterium]|nr:DUF896 domain-containing protein [Clostridiales bacterium]
MLDKVKLDRINELANKKKKAGLTAEEAAEQQQLRQAYIERFREVFRAQLDQIEVVDGDAVTDEKFPN